MKSGKGKKEEEAKACKEIDDGGLSTNVEHDLSSERRALVFAITYLFLFILQFLPLSGVP